MPVLVSYANYSKWMDQYLPSYDRVLVDSGAFSEMNSGKKVDLGAYADWAGELTGIDAWAGLDDISGDWKRSLENYKHGGFPTIHDTDPPELLDELIGLSGERGNWLGVGLKPPRHNKAGWIEETLDRIPRDIHVHGWALRAYTKFDRLDSVDSTNWFRDAMKLRRDLPWITYGEACDLIVKRYKRWHKIPEGESQQMRIPQ
jgi:hypothetical protein